MTQARRIVLRADASQSIGTGHVVRCATLASEFRRRGWRATMACRELPPVLEELLVADGIEVLRLPAMPIDDEPGYLGAQLGPGVDDVVTDNYSIGETWQRQAAAWASLVVAIDDLADRRQAVRLLLNQNIGVDEARYKDLVESGTRLLIGPTYALLRSEFAAARAQGRRRTGAVERILVFMSGGDQANLTLVAARAAAGCVPAVDVVVGSAYGFEADLRALASEFPNVAVHVNTTHMADLMDRADLAVGAPSSASWERCALGLPAVVVILADNQVEVASGLVDAGAAVSLGWYDRVAETDIGGAVQALAADPARLLAMSAAASQLADGLGAARVADAIEDLLGS